MRLRLLLCLLVSLVTLAGCETMDKARENAVSSFTSIKGSLFGASSRVPTDEEAGKSRKPVEAITTPKANVSIPPIISGAVLSKAVIDGDTIILNNRRIRLYGIDAPERAQRCEIAKVSVACGVIARNILLGFVVGTTVRCERQDIDRYGRDVSLCFADTFDLSAGMVNSGFAVAYRQYSKAYISHETKAKRLKRGMWRGTFVMPWNWRAQRRNSGFRPNSDSL